MPKNSKQKLNEYGPLHERHLRAGVQFIVKYCGSQLIEDIRRGQLFSSSVVSTAIQSLLEFNRKTKRRSRVAVLQLSTGGVSLRLRATDPVAAPAPAPGAGAGGGSDDRVSQPPPLVSASIERIAYCTADKRNARVFAFVARNRVNETVELHVCKCVDAKEPVQMAYTLNEAFTVAARDQKDLEQQQQQQQSAVDEDASQQQPAVWCDSQAMSMAQGAAGHGEWVQFA